jgi:hypothetical protein
MNLVERRDLAAAAAETFPELRFAGLEEALAPLEAAQGGAWSVSVGPGGFEDAEWERELPQAGGLAEQLGLGVSLPPGPARAGLRWDAREGRVAALWIEAGGRRLERSGSGPARSLSLRPHKLDSRLFADPGLASRVSLFDARCPVASAVVEFEGEGKAARPTGRWGLELSKPEPWPRFLRLDLSGPFAERHAALSFLLLTRRVRELRFEGESPRARLGA